MSLNTKHDRFKTLQTICTLAFVALVIGIFFKITLFFYVSLAFLLIGLFFRRLSEVLANGWMKFAKFIGIVNTKIILTLVFYGFLTPLAFFYRITHGDFMHLKRDTKIDTYYELRGHEYRPEDLEKLW